MEKERAYLIPVNVPMRFEFFSGIGVKEIINIGITLLISIVVRFIAAAFGAGYGTSFLIIIVPPVFVGMLYSKSSDGSSVAQTLAAIKIFTNSQKKYLYSRRDD